MTSFNPKGLAGAMAMAVVMVGCGGSHGAGHVELTQKIGAGGGVVDLSKAGLRIDVPVGAVSTETEFQVVEVEHAGAHRAFEIHASGALEHAVRIRFARPEGTSGRALKVVKVDDHGVDAVLEQVSEAEHAAEVEPGDDKNWQESVDVDDSTLDGTFVLEPGDDNGLDDPATHDVGDDNGVDPAPAPVTDPAAPPPPVDDHGNDGAGHT